VLFLELVYAFAKELLENRSVNIIEELLHVYFDDERFFAPFPLSDAHVMIYAKRGPDGAFAILTSE